MGTTELSGVNFADINRAFDSNMSYHFKKTQLSKPKKTKMNDFSFFNPADTSLSSSMAMAYKTKKSDYTSNRSSMEAINRSFARAKLSNALNIHNKPRAVRNS